MPENGKQSMEERLERWADKPSKKGRMISPERAAKLNRRADKFLNWTRVLCYGVVGFPLLAALYRFRAPSALIEAEGDVTGKGIPSGTTVTKIYVSIDDPSAQDRWLMASPWLLLAVLLAGVLWSLRLVERKTQRVEGNPYPITALIALGAVEVGIAFGLWCVAVLLIIGRDSVGTAALTDAEMMFGALTALITGFMCVTVMTVISRATKDHKALEEIV